MAGFDVSLQGVGRFEASLERLVVQAEAAGRVAVTQGAHLVEAETKKALSRQGHKKGTPTPSQPGEPPATVSGTLKRSVRPTQAHRLGFGDYQAEVGPTVVYARVQELGGSTGRSTLPSRPSLKPSLEKSRPKLAAIYRTAWERAIRP